MADFLIISVHFHCNFLNLCVERWRSSFLRNTVGIPRWAFWNSCIPMTMSDHWILLLPVLKIRLVWTLHHQGWTLITVSKCRHWSHLLLRRVQPCLREKKLPSGYRKIHQQIGHRDNRTLVRLLKQRGTHPWVLKMARDHRCSACEESKPPALRHITSSYENVPGAILEIDGMHWQHPVTGRHARCQFMVDVGSRALRSSLFLKRLESVRIATTKPQSARSLC